MWLWRLLQERLRQEAGLHSAIDEVGDVVREIAQAWHQTYFDMDKTIRNSQIKS
jgi:flagellin-specific chaperone FliS